MLAYRDPDGVTWVNCFDGDDSTFHGTLLQWTERQLTKVAVPQDLENIQVRAMTKDSAGNFWISVVLKGIYKFRDGVWTHIDIFKDNPTVSASAAITDSRDRIWLAYPRRKQIAVLTEGSVRNLYTERDFSIGTVSLLARSGEQIWAAGDSGIAFFQGDEFHTVSADDGSTFADVDRIVPTAVDGVWLSAHQGIVHIPEEEIEHVFSDPSYKVKYETYDQLSDLPDRLQAEGSGYVSAVQGGDGVLWFATRNGVARIDPRKISKNRLAPPVTIRSISADGKEYAFSNGTTLPPLTKSLRVEYTALSLSIPERVRFRYKLDGWDRDWQDAGARREAFYTNLAPGNYRFHVTACNNDGVWNDVGAILDFSVAPAWYQTNWFMVVCLFAGLLVLITAYRLRVRQIARAMSARFDERLAERTRVAREIHDTFLQTVQGSKMVADHALKYSADHARMVRAMEQLSTWLEQATEEGRAALHSLRASTTEKNDLAEAFRRAIDECGRVSRAETSFSVNGDSREMHPVVRDEIYRIGYEAIRNSCAHSGGDRLEVTLEYAHDLTFGISDNGVGIGSEVVENGKEGHFGLRGMRERAQRIGSKFTLVSSPDSGTVITLVVPGRIAFRTARPIWSERIKSLFNPN
jgi:signal transduction histidine kinase